MSISAMTNLAFVRRQDVPPEGLALATHGAIEQATGGTADSKNAVAVALNSLVTYIPTEILTLYVGAIGLVPHPAAPDVAPSEWITFGSFVVMTPVVVWLVYAGRVRTADKPLPMRWAQWPLWEMCVATIAFAAWAFGLPSSPFRAIPVYSTAVAGFMVLVASCLIALVAPIVSKPLNP